MTNLEGKVCLITDAASGIGEEALRLFVEHGAFVVAADVQDELGEKVVASTGSDRVAYHHCDVRDEKQVEETVNFTLEKFGNLHVLHSNAGIMESYSSIVDFDLEAFDKVMAINVLGVAATIKYGAQAMIAKETRGSIVCTTSVTSKMGGYGPHAYTVSKHALLGLVRTACKELGLHGIRVNSISPFGVATPLACESTNTTPDQLEAVVSGAATLKGIVLKARHVGEAALFLASDESAYTTGHNLMVDGGWTATSPVFISKFR